MGRNSFQFKKFTVFQDRCAMKVGTDGTLLGAWAEAPVDPCRILDIGTGTGLVALMMAQRYESARILGIEIDGDAAHQALDNVKQSPFSDRIEIVCGDVAKISDKIGFDSIVCNPPYFVDSLTCPENQRTLARHAVSLTYKELLKSVGSLLKDTGKCSLIIPAENQDKVESLATFEGLFLSRICLVKTTPQKLPKRHLLEFQKCPVQKVDFQEHVIEDIPGVRSDWYRELTSEFYLK